MRPARTTRGYTAHALARLVLTRGEHSTAATTSLWPGPYRPT